MMKHQVSTHSLKSGAELLAVNLPHSGSVQFNTYVRSGYRYANPQHYELPHLLEHLAFEGTKRYPNGPAFNEPIDRTGSYANALTNPDENVYEFSTSPEQIWNILPLAVSQLFEPLFKNRSIAQEKAVIESELSEYQEDPERRVGYLLNQTQFPSLRPSWKARVRRMKTIGRPDIVRFHREMYGTRNMRFVAAGPFGSARVRRLRNELNRLLAGRPRGRRINWQPARLGNFQRKIKLLPASWSQQYFSLDFALAGYDERSLASLRLLCALCDESPSARLYQKVRRAGLAYGIDVDRGSDRDMTGLTVSAEASSQKFMSLLKLVVSELSALRRGRFTDSELELARGNLIGGMARTYETPRDYADWYGERFAEDRSLISPEMRRREYAAIDRGQLIDTAQRYLTRDNWLLVVGGNHLPKEVSLQKTLDAHF